MTSLTSLIERIEAATDSDQELDRLVHYHLAVVKSDRFTEQSWIDLAKKQNWNAPRYSISIDAALTLLPEGWWWSAGVCRRENHASVGTEIGTVEGELIFETFGATAPLAILAAILRARQTEARG